MFHLVTSIIDTDLDIMSRLIVISCLYVLISTQTSLTSPVGPSLNSGSARAALAGLGVVGKVAQKRCNDVGVKNYNNLL